MRDRERKSVGVWVCARVCYVNIFIHEYIQACLCVSRWFVCSYLYLYVYTCVHRSTDIYHTHVWMYTCNYLRVGARLGFLVSRQLVLLHTLVNPLLVKSP